MSRALAYYFLLLLSAAWLLLGLLPFSGLGLYPFPASQLYWITYIVPSFNSLFHLVDLPESRFVFFMWFPVALFGFLGLAALLLLKRIPRVIYVWLVILLIYFVAASVSLYEVFTFGLTGGHGLFFLVISVCMFLSVYRLWVDKVV